MKERETELRERMAEAPDESEAMRELARLIGAERGRKAEAVELWQSYVETVDAADVPAALLALGRAQVEARREADAIETLRRCTEEAPELPEAFEVLGALLRRAGDLESAADAFSRAAELQPDAVQPLLALVACLDEGGRSAEAGAVLGSIQKLGSGDPAVLALIQELMQRRG